MKNSTRLLLLRHAEVEEKYHRVFGGRIDMNLSARGHEQAHALARYLARECFDAIYSSPQQRAQQTLRPILESFQGAHTCLPDLREIDFGDWTGLTWEELETRHQISAFRWLEMMEKAAIPNGECSTTFRNRIEPCLRQILEKHPGGKIGIVAHGGVIRMLLALLLDLPLAKTAHFEIEYASLTEIHVSPQKIELQRLNFTPWRDL
jgi:broad specificity phosphatase PhoE